MTISRVAIVHDYLTQRGGAERVVAAMLRAFPGAPVFTSLYDPDQTFDEFRGLEIRTSALQHLPTLRRAHRRALPLLAPAFMAMGVNAEVAICSSSGWSHGARVSGKKLVYCYTPARWLYQGAAYLGDASWCKRSALAGLRPALVKWDQQSARSADRYLAISTAVRDRIRHAYGIDAKILPPPCAIDADGAWMPISGLEGGFWLCVSRLLPYKNIGQVVKAFESLSDHRLVVVGDGPMAGSLRETAPNNVFFIEHLSDANLRWAYANSRGLVAASFEDFGLTPVEAAAFGKPSVVLAWGGFLDTVTNGETGIYFEDPVAGHISAAIRDCESISWDADRIRASATRFSEEKFASKLRLAVDSVLADNKVDLN